MHAFKVLKLFVILLFICNIHPLNHVQSKKTECIEEKFEENERKNATYFDYLQFGIIRWMVLQNVRY